MQAPRLSVISGPGLKCRLRWSDTRRMALCGERGRSEDAQRRCNSHVATQARGCSRTLLLAGQHSIERRVRRTHRGNLALLAHVGTQVRPPPGNERATKQARAARHVMPTTRTDSLLRRRGCGTHATPQECTRTSFDAVSSARWSALSKTGEVTCASQGRNTREIKE